MTVCLVCYPHKFIANPSSAPSNYSNYTIHYYFVPVVIKTSLRVAKAPAPLRCPPADLLLARSRLLVHVRLTLS